MRYKKVKYIKHCTRLVLIDALTDEVRIRSLASYLEGKEINKGLSQNEKACLPVSNTLSWNVSKKRI